MTPDSFCQKKKKKKKRQDSKKQNIKQNDLI